MAIEKKRRNNTTLMGDTRHYCIDKLKVLCSFLVIYIHAPFPGIAGKYVVALARIAVPLFFMISGFFYTVGSFSKQVKKLLFLLIFSNIFYFLWNGILAITKGTFHTYIVSVFEPKAIIKFILFNENSFQSHLWYLGAIIYVILFVTLIIHLNEKKGRRILYIITPILLLGDLILGKYSLLILQKSFPIFCVRNWLFVGIPYFTVGMYLRERSSKIIKQSHLYFLIILSIFTTFIEKYCLTKCGLNATRDHYFSTTLLAFFVFVYFFLYVDNDESIVSRIGRNDSTWLYIMHPIFIIICSKLSTLLHMKQMYEYTQPLIVFVATLVTIEVFIKTKQEVLSKNSPNLLCSRSQPDKNAPHKSVKR